MKWYKVCNRISLLLHALCSALGYFLIEMISRRSFSAAWTYMTTKPLVFAYNAALIFTTSLLSLTFPPFSFQISDPAFSRLPDSSASLPHTLQHSAPVQTSF